MRTFFLFLFLIASFKLPAQQRAQADLPTRKIEDDSSLRIAIRGSWLAESPGMVINKRAEYYTLSGGSRIQVRSEAGRDEFVVVLARELPGLLSARNSAGNFPGWAQGSWILSRRISDGSPSRIRVFLKSDPNSYIQFRPFTQDKCYMDVVIYEAYLVYSLPVAIPFERLIVLPLEDALAAVGETFPRRYFDPEPLMYRDKWNFIAAVRARLSGLHYTDDGAIDENNKYVYINTLDCQNPDRPDAAGGLNCSGFAKWIVDGILKPVTGETLSIAPLKEAYGNRGSSFTEPWERLRDPFFGLDWNRNLASIAGTVLRSPVYADPQEFEVRSMPFSRMIQRQNGSASIRSYPGFLPDAGFDINGLQALLYTLAIDEPDRIYLAAVNNEIGAPVTTENPKGAPRLRQYFHVAVLAPYFAENGNFQITVFESAAETPFASFKNRYPGHYVNLSRIPLDRGFDPD
ncbi:MAG: hypothetical protein LBH43_19285 [Treponema sp.]|jgi:hypothetical protein|nr:hypothetical protein [Treponema sp.]